VLDQIWTAILDFTSKLVIPDWGALIGLIPIVGDLITTAISLWLVREARALGAPWHITARMLANVAVDGVVGMVPVAGDAFDVMFRANVRNVRMLKRWMDKQPRL